MAPKKDVTKAKAGSKPVPKSTGDKKAAPKAADGKKAPLRQVKKAQQAQKKVVKGRFGTRVKKPRTSVHFSRPRTFRPARAPKYSCVELEKTTHRPPPQTMSPLFSSSTESDTERR